MTWTRSTALLSILGVLGFAGCDAPSPDPSLEPFSYTGGLVISPEADTFVRSGSHASRNFGTKPTVQTDLDSSGTEKQGFIRFRIGEVGPLTRATLRLYVADGSKNAADIVAIADSTWGEETMTWQNKPATAGKVVAAIGAVSRGRWIEADVTASVAPSSVLSLALISRSTDGLDVNSREASTNRPELVLALDSAPPDSDSGAPPALDSGALPASDAAAPAGELAFPIRAAFYYPWFPNAWKQGGVYPYTKYTPTAGYYSSSDPAAIKQHIQAMQYGGIQAAIASWWGQGHHTDAALPVILAASAGSGFRWAIYHENESQGDPTASQIGADLTYLQGKYSQDPSFLRVGGRMVVFVYADAADGCGMATRWKLGNTVGAYLVLKVFPGYASCADQPDGWHQYAPAQATQSHLPHSYVISPGFDKVGEPTRLARDLTRWQQNVKAMVASGAKWQLVTTFNEWGEGTSVESAKEWSSTSGHGQYLDALHDNASVQPPPPPPPPSSACGNGTCGSGESCTSCPADCGACPPSNGNDPILFINGDLVSGSTVARAQKVVTLIKNLMAQHAGTQMLVASTGDLEQEDNPTIADYQQYFGATYGTFVNQGIFMQVRGNHDKQSVGGGQAYWDYFGAAAHDNNGLTNYSYEMGSWHIVGLDQLNGTVKPETLAFLKADLAAHASTKCQLVYWHVPTYSSGAAHGDAIGLKPINQAEYDAGVDIQLNGHDHHYQRFLPISPSGQQDNAKGITTFIVGIGGKAGRSGSQTSIAQAASAKYLDTFPGGSGDAIGVVMFTLHATSADYALYNANDGSVLDQGTVNCH